MLWFTEIIQLKGIMKVYFYSTHQFERKYIDRANKNSISIEFSEKELSEKTAELAKGCVAISIFTSDNASEKVLKKLSFYGIKYISIRAAGYDNIDLMSAKSLGMKVANVPKYSPNAIAEHTISLIQALNRKILIADKQVHRYNFKIDNLIGFNLINKTVGIIGTGNIGSAVIKILNGFGCKLIAYDIIQNIALEKEFNLKYTELETLFKEADIISIHIPLNKETKYLINSKNIQLMKDKVMIVNTSRGAIVNTGDILEYLKKGKIGFYAADVYENEKNIFFKDLSHKKNKDETLSHLLSFKNVLITPHQAFATEEALENIAAANIHNLQCFDESNSCDNEIKFF